MEYYLGTDLALDSDGDIAIKDGDLDIVSGLDCLKTNLADRIFADNNELLLHPDFGASLLANVSLPLSPDNITTLTNEITHELLAEPRIAEVLSVESENIGRFIYITAKVRTIDNQIIDNLIFPFELEAL
jgi:hypothetical protein